MKKNKNIVKKNEYTLILGIISTIMYVLKAYS